MTSPIQNILTGVQQQAQAREQAERKADVLNEQEKQGPAVDEAEQVQDMESMTPVQMQEAIQILSKAVMELTNKNGNGEMK